jgi:RIO kinase 1
MAHKEYTMSEPTLDAFFREGWITDVSQQVKSGKEATVYCCRAAATTGVGLLAAKVYRDRHDRTFRHDAVYQEGRYIHDRRLRKSAAKGTSPGRALQFSIWIEHEFTTLCLLHAAGADVPQPVACAAGGTLLEYTGEARPRRHRATSAPADAILMHFVGDEAGMPAPLLQRAPMERAEALPLFRRIMRNIELWLAHDRVHADLSPFNILYRQGAVTVIDFPQAVDPQTNPNAQALLARDITNICRFFARYGVQSDPRRITDHLWRRYWDGEL